MTRRPNILLITADQWRGDSLGCAGHPTLKTPNVDTLAKQGTLFTRHFAATAPCSPARASLYTGLYQMNHRVIWNGSPLDARFDTIALAARRAGYRPTLFGYTDTAPDPRRLAPEDPALLTYEGILPGFEVGQILPEDDGPWLDWLKERGYGEEDLAAIHHVETEPGERVSLKPAKYGANETQTAFLTGKFLDWLAGQENDQPWFAHVSFLRPHPPLCAPPPYNTLYDPEDDAGFEGTETDEEEAAFHPLVKALQQTQKISSHVPGADGLVRDLSRRDLKRIRALYRGMISEVDAQLGRLLEGLRTSGMDEDTVILFTSDHAEMMGDHWMLGKGGFYPQSYHIPLVIRLPGATTGQICGAFTSATDIFPTLADLMDIAPEHAPDGQSLLPILRGEAPEASRNSAVFEYDFRNLSVLPEGIEDGAKSGLSVLCLQTRDWLYVHCPTLPPVLMKTGAAERHQNLAGDPGYRDVLLDCQSRLLSTRMQLNDETLSQKLVWEFYSEQPQSRPS